ncbi:MAG: class I SAM-dependent methyltransferase [Elusimicrobia bacterium]|nr:class I SAM-dependent methyltransferase [Elusimicrobiota bacterium]
MSGAPGLETVPCPVCGGTRASVLFERPYAGGDLSDVGTYAATTDCFNGYGRVVRCAGCGMVFTNPRPTAQTLARGYGECVDEAYLEESAARSINAFLSLRTIERFCRSGRLLEFGCSVGYFLNAARVDFEVTGVEPSSWACRAAKERFRLDVVEGTLASAALAASSFDAVAMIDVIEHLPDPGAAVVRAGELLKPGGILYLVTPDIDSLSARLLGGSWWGLRPAHIQYFSAATLGRLLSERGFEVVQSRSFGRIFSWGYWLSRLANYPAPVRAAVESFVRALDIRDKLLYLDTRDSVELCARRR